MCRTLKETLILPSQPINQVIKLSTLDQHALRMYSNFVMVFHKQSGDDILTTIQQMEDGLGAALTQHPDFAANVVPKLGSTRKELELYVDPESGVPFKIVDHSSCVDGSEDCPGLLRNSTYEVLKKKNFPLTKIPDKALFIQNASPEGNYPEGIPSLLVQANIIEGGLLLGISWHHSVSDASGINTFLKAWSKATQMSCIYESMDDGDFSGNEISEKWMLSCGTRGATMSDFPEYVADASARSPNTGHPHLLDCSYVASPEMQMSMWHFSKDSLLSLVNLLGDPAVESAQRCTQIEALSALLWKHLSQARRLHISLPEGTSLFTTRIDYRRRMFPPLPRSYIGNANQPVPRTRIPIQEVCAPSTPESLGTLASHIRRCVAVNDGKIVRRLIGYVDTLPTVTDLALEFDTFPGPDIAITDLSGLNTMHQDWGGCFGRAVCIRGFVRYKGFAAFLPQDIDGGISVIVQCEAWAFKRLKIDPVFTRYGRVLY